MELSEPPDLEFLGRMVLRFSGQPVLELLIEKVVLAYLQLELA